MYKIFPVLILGLLLAALAVVAGPAAAADQTAVQTRSAQTQWVILVRHAEKSAEPAGDPELTEAGKRRAQSIIEVVRHWAVDAIVTTQWHRTRATAAPLAESLGITPMVVATDDAGTAAHARKIATAVRALDAQTVLVVGHSNTVPAIIAALGGPVIPEIADDEYANLFVLQAGDEPARLMRARY